LSGEPVVIGLLVQESGATAASNKPAASAARAWEKWANENGGVAGHPVKVEIKDSAADPAKAVSLAQELVEKDGAIALVMQDPAVDTAIASYVDSKKVPVLSVNGSYGLWYTDPNYFSLGTEYYPAATKAVAAIAKSAGASVFANVVCAETPSCSATSAVYETEAGVQDIKYDGVIKVSADQASFVAACIKLKSDNVQFLDVALSSATSSRLIKDCGVQNYRPILHFPFAAFNQSLKSQSGMTAYSVQPVQLWYADTPAAATFREALDREGATPEVASMEAWAALMVVKEALKDTQSPITTGSVFEGMYGLSGYDADGLLAQKLAFTKGSNSPVLSCYFVGGLKDGEFFSPDGTSPKCPQK